MGTPEFKPNLNKDPLLGSQEHPDDKLEQQLTPEREAAADPTHGSPRKSRVTAGVLGLLLATSASTASTLA